MEEKTFFSHLLIRKKPKELQGIFGPRNYTGQLPDTALGAMKLSWSPLLPCFWFRGQWLPGTHSLWDSLGHQFSSPSQQTLTSSFVLQSHCPPFSVSFLINFTSTPMSLFCISIFSWRPHISHQASCELRCLCATGPGHIHIRMGDIRSQSCFSVVSLLNLLATLRRVPSQVSVSRQSSTPPASECSQGLFPFLSFIHSTNSNVAPRCARHGTKKRSPFTMELTFCDGPSNRKDKNMLGCPKCSREWAGRDGKRHSSIQRDFDKEGTQEKGYGSCHERGREPSRSRGKYMSNRCNTDGD